MKTMKLEHVVIWTLIIITSGFGVWASVSHLRVREMTKKLERAGAAQKNADYYYDQWREGLGELQECQIMNSDLLNGLTEATRTRRTNNYHYIATNQPATTSRSMYSSSYSSSFAEAWKTLREAEAQKQLSAEDVLDAFREGVRQRPPTVVYQPLPPPLMPAWRPIGGQWRSQTGEILPIGEID